VKTISTTVVAIAAVIAAGIASGQDSASNTAKPGAQPACCMDSKAQMGQMDAHMKQMQALHEKVASATTAEERQRIMDEQRQEMQQGMAMMQPMQHGGAPAGGAGMKMMDHNGTPADQATRMQMMEKRMDMMQTMMQTMMDQQGSPAPGMMPAPKK
jgi:hypothetical protein